MEGSDGAGGDGLVAVGWNGFGELLGVLGMHGGVRYLNTGRGVCVFDHPGLRTPALSCWS